MSQQVEDGTYSVTTSLGVFNFEVKGGKPVIPREIQEKFQELYWTGGGYGVSKQEYGNFLHLGLSFPKMGEPEYLMTKIEKGAGS
jgi:hypothetical protein